VIRSALYDVFQAFDFAEPSTSNGQRVATTVAPQALFMLNDRLVLRGAEAMARRLLAPPGFCAADRIRLAYETALGRPATDREVARALEYLLHFESKAGAEGWQSLCQAIIASSEFIYLD
jgi:hypothetical protein